MKNSLLAAFALVASLLLAPAAARAQNSSSLLTGNGPSLTNGTFVIKNITVGFPKTPEFQTIGGETQAKRYTLGTWIEVEVEFSSTAPAAEVAFHYNLAINNKLLVGDQTLEDVPAGQALFTVVYVSPRTLSALLKNQPVTVSALQNAQVMIQRPGVAAPLAVKFLKEGGAGFFAQAQQIPGFVLNKNQTPFANLWWDRYETVKQNQGR